MAESYYQSTKSPWREAAPITGPWLVGLVCCVLSMWTLGALGTGIGQGAIGLFIVSGVGSTVAGVRRMKHYQARAALHDQLATMVAQHQYADALATSRAHMLLTEAGEHALESVAVERTESERLVTTLRGSCESLGLHVTSQRDTVVNLGQAVRDMTRTLQEEATAQRGVHDKVETLSLSAEQSASSVLEMVAINNEVRQNIHSLAQSVQETTTAIEEMTFSSKEVAKNIDELSTAAEETAASMNQMDVSIGQVENNATETSKLSETVSRDAETGVAAIKQTIQGIDKIKDSSRIAADVIANLGQKISEIGNILNVIDDVAEQTNLLALNAAIIAAQAGEHGRGFAVVADEIKALAERTGASTKEIAELVKTIQDQSRRATGVMSEGVENVEDGVRLGHNAEDALRKIVDSAKRSTLMIQAIAQATVEQTKGSKQVTNAISRIAETAQQIAYATAEQAKGAEHIMQSAEAMRSITQQVERSADEQNRGGRQITTAMENIRQVVEHIDRAQDAQGQSARVVSQSVTKITVASEHIERLLGKSQAELDSLGLFIKR